jgi:tetratricopeptide (TPR) repeat protein
MNLNCSTMRRYSCLVIFIIYCSTAVAQSAKIDSLQHLLQTEKQDSNRVTLLWKLAEQYQFFKPDTTLQLAQQAFLLAQHIKYKEGESRSLAVMATGQYLLGNYSAALNNYMQKLQLEEKRNSSRNYASALNNIGLMYILLADYPNALGYLHKADSTVEAAGAEVKKELKNRVLVNLGESFYRMKHMDSAKYYFTQALQIGLNNNDDFYQGASLLGMGNVESSIGNDSIAMNNYRSALFFLNDGTNNDMLCETALGLANIFQKNGQPDSALHYARLAFVTGKKDGFLSRELDAAGFLSHYYKSKKNYDSAFNYIELTVALQDSLKGQAKTREAMIISSNEQLRQAELAEQKQREKEARLQQLQILAICIFIPMFFIITLAVSQIRIHRNVVRFMGVVSLLLFFEFLVLLLHPLIEQLMHHNKVLELLVLVVIGAGLVPLHHRLEHLVITKLTNPRLLTPSSPGAINAHQPIAATEGDIIEDLPFTAAIALPEEEQDNTPQKKPASAAGTTEAGKQ